MIGILDGGGAVTGMAVVVVALSARPGLTSFTIITYVDLTSNVKPVLYQTLGNSINSCILGAVLLPGGSHHILLLWYRPKWYGISVRGKCLR